MGWAVRELTSASLSAKERRWIELASVGGLGAYDALEHRLYRVLHEGTIGLDELGEFVLQFAVHVGWPRAAEFERAVRRQWERVVLERGGQPQPWPLRQSESPLHEYRRDQQAAAEDCFRTVNRIEVPRRDTPFMDVGVLGFVFGHVWQRPGLALRERRIIALTCCALVGAPHPVQVQVRSALDSADLSHRELWELVDHMSTHLPESYCATLRTALSSLEPTR